MPLVTRIKNIYGLGVVTWTVCKILDILTFSPYKCLCYQIWPWPKIGQGHPRVIIWINYDGPESPMLHTKFRGNRPSGSREEDFWMVFTIYGHGGHLGHVAWTPRTNFRSPIPWRLHMKFGFNRHSGFGEEEVWKCWRQTDIQTTALPYDKLANEPSAQVN